MYKYLAYLLLFTSCSLSQRIGNRLPQTHKDSTAVARLCTTVFPTDTIRTEYVVVSNPGLDSSDYFRAIADSLLFIDNNIRADVETVYKDTCTSAKLIYAKGYNTGFDVGYNSGRAKPIHDTTTYLRTITIENQAKLLLANVEKRTAQRQVAKEQWHKAIWRTMALIFMCLFFALLVCTYFIVKGSFTNKTLKRV